jgi:hypothetical protein
LVFFEEEPLSVGITIPRLSETLNPLTWPHMCQRCGLRRDGLEVWRECDDADRPEMIFVVLCRQCSLKVIEPHVRLYGELGRNEPAPGVMRICEACHHQVAGRCRSPRALANGGEGLPFPGPSANVHLLFGNPRRGKCMKIWDAEPTECVGRETEVVV